MTCEHWRMEISMWLDNELDDEAQHAMYQHLASCPGCRAFLADARKLHAALMEEKASYGGQEVDQDEAHVSLFRLRIHAPFASVVLGVLLACLFSLFLGVSLAGINPPSTRQ